ncbi:hypothetical protein SMQE13_14480 [Serratia marcescens]|nr:hypothetical protein SMQE13_14480 [Serratia marcescens]
MDIKINSFGDALKPLIRRLVKNSRATRLLSLLVVVAAAVGCADIKLYRSQKATEVTLRFTHDGEPMRFDNYAASARQIGWIKTCRSLFFGPHTCDVGSENILMTGGHPLDANGEAKVTVKSIGPIGDNPAVFCIKGRQYVYSPGPWVSGPFKPGQVVNINYKITEAGTHCSASSITPFWWDKS